MKNILRIAKIELSLLFYSPVAWIVLLVFIFQTGWLYASMLERMEQAQQMGQQATDLTNIIFAGFRSLFPQVQEYLYLYIPLLTMGLISRETHSGSIKLLYSSPIRMVDIVGGKYLAMIIYCLMLMGCLLLLGAITMFTVENADFLFILSGIIGLYLLICAYSAIGLFMSSLTSYQVVAAISTLVVLAMLNFVGTLWQDINFVRDITYFLSINGRAEESINGLLSTNDVFYFLIVIVLFLGLTLLKLQFERRTVSLSAKMLKYTLLVVSMLLLGYLSSRPQLIAYADMTANHRRTLTLESRKIIAKFDEPVSITTYVNLLDENYYMGLPSYLNADKKNFDMYFRYMPYMRMDYVLYWDHSTNERLYQENPGLSDEQLARKVAKASDLDFETLLRPEQIAKRIDLKPERNRVVRVVAYKGKSTMLRIFDDLFKTPSEKEISAALKRLIVNPPRVGFSTGHRERDITRSGDRDYQVSTNEIAFRYSLINQGFDVKQVSLEDTALIKHVDILVLADAITSLNPKEIKNLTNYIAAGGNMLIAVEPGSAVISNPVLALLNTKLAPGMLVQKSKNFDPSFILGGLAIKNWTKLVKNSSFVNKDTAFVTTPTAAVLEQLPGNRFENLPVLVTQAADTWQIDGLAADKTSELVDLRKNENKKSFPIAYALRRKQSGTEQRMFIIGDADFMSNAEMVRTNPRAINFTFVTELLGWFSKGQFPIDTTRPQPVDNHILVSDEEIKWIKWAMLAILPGLIAVSVSLMLISRKRR
ncbi:ABC transporter permease subunit [Pedobacter petrophilus]|uniref:ABC transporter permease subunit n=1 Tax=Pedobacter petrophilus TaxID=1908241 RepID=A0A7K0FVX6_9SPHI|nr:Gldg family protein [Pedobacter petrophilus]MRX75757.1 ABC transporter permease subunit [Pedobacter petrophilus]